MFILEMAKTLMYLYSKWTKIHKTLQIGKLRCSENKIRTNCLLQGREKQTQNI